MYRAVRKKKQREEEKQPPVALRNVIQRKSQDHWQKNSNGNIVVAGGKFRKQPCLAAGRRIGVIHVIINKIKKQRKNRKPVAAEQLARENKLCQKPYGDYKLRQVNPYFHGINFRYPGNGAHQPVI